AAAACAVLGELSPRTPLVHVRAVLAPAAGASRAACGRPDGQDGTAAGLPCGVAARDLAARRFDWRTATRRHGAAHLTKKGGPVDRPCLASSCLYCLGQGWTFISGPRSYGGGTCASVVTWADSAQSKARLARPQNSLSTGARWAVRLANSVTRR